MATPPDVLHQAAAIAVRDGEICLVSSRSGKRWIIPKGCMEAGKSASEIALQEAWEEAGLVGSLQPEPVGSYLYKKDDRTCHVLVYLMQVTQVAEQWPEQSWRERTWMRFAQVLGHIEDSGLRELIRRVTPVRSENRPAGVALG
jgi:8-oxo-dGTP pyrophosphatase MutT (NUDIX family)